MYPDNDSISAGLFERGRRVMPGGNSRVGVMFEPYPIYAAHGSGCRVTDVDGIERIDLINNWSSLIHGHGNREVLDAIRAQSEKLLCVGAPTEVEIELAAIESEVFKKISEGAAPKKVVVVPGRLVNVVV